MSTEMPDLMGERQKYNNENSMGYMRMNGEYKIKDTMTVSSKIQWAKMRITEKCLKIESSLLGNK